MKLSIDTSDRKKIILKIKDKVYDRSSKTQTSQSLLAFIDNVLKNENIGLQDIKAIEVNAGPGSFTGLRVGVSVAQALGWCLGIKVNGRDISKGAIIPIRYR